MKNKNSMNFHENFCDLRKKYDAEELERRIKRT